MQTTWILAADAGRARIFEIPDRHREIREVEDFLNPAGRAHGRDLQSDANGRYHEGQSVSPRTDPVEHEVENFSKTLGDYLDKARVQHRYDRLCVIAPPEFLGLIRQNLTKEVHKLVDKEIPKDLSRLDAAGIGAYVRSGEA